MKDIFKSSLYLKRKVIKVILSCYLTLNCFPFVKIIIKLRNIRFYSLAKKELKFYASSCIIINQLCFITFACMDNNISHYYL